jgi:hypothetical protein
MSELVFENRKIWIRGGFLYQIEPRSIMCYTNDNVKPGALCLTCYKYTISVNRCRQAMTKRSLSNHCLYGLLLALLDPVWVGWIAAVGGGPGGGVYSGDGSPGAGWLLVGPVLNCEGSTLVAPLGG